MAEPSTDTVGIKSHYATQISADLERNAQGQEEISAQLNSLKDQLSTLQQDRALLVTMQRSLAGQVGTPAVTVNGTAAPAANGAAPAESAATAPSPAQKAAKRRRGQAAKLPLREVLSTILAEHEGPRSAAEVAAVLSQNHPERNASIPVVRNTLEGMVAKGQATRKRQQKSVFYSTAEVS
ncbi:hypothetical protein ACFQ71_41185 [Streptomyces sp. NPDC056534]|uniref:hypothetical protein n=1 Tax=Streptomyces sp. NPDC056534 TaxID=3345857 RepID=UPI0036CC3FBE